MVTKKGEVEIQFNWILILVAGGLIFLFFFSIINWVREGSDQGISITLARNLDAILTGASVPRETASLIGTIPFNKIEFTCDGYKVDKSVNFRQVDNKIIFSPNRLEEGIMLTWSFGWDVPFRVSNFLFVSSPKIRYIFITTAPSGLKRDLFDYLNKTFPRELNPEFYTSWGAVPFDDYNNFKVRIVYIGSTPQDQHIIDLRRMAGEDVTALEIMPSSELSGTVTFYKKTNPAIAAGFDCYSSCPLSIKPYFNYASLLGAIFSENPDDYECNMDKAFQRLNLIAEIYQGKVNSLDSYYGFGDSCQIYSSAETILSGMVTLDFSSISQLESKYYDLEDENNLVQRTSCALIY